MSPDPNGGPQRRDGAAPPEGQPAPSFRVTGAAYQPYAAVPTLEFAIAVQEPSGREIYTIAVSAQIAIAPVRRSHDAATRELLADLFGAAERWGATARTLPWTRVDVLLPSFTGETAFELPVTCTYDLEVAATKYFESLPDGEIPLVFHFSGTILYRGEADRLQVVRVPWSGESAFRLPLATWRDMIRHHYPHGGWIPLHAETIERLRRIRAERGLPSFDACLAELLDPVTEGKAPNA